MLSTTSGVIDVFWGTSVMIHSDSIFIRMSHVFISSLHQPQAERRLPIELVVPWLSKARATIRRVLLCVLGSIGVSRILLSSTAEQSFEGDVQVRTKSRLSKENKGNATGPESARESASTRDIIGRGSATESASTRASAKRDASLGIKATLTDRNPHDHLPTSKRDTNGAESARESASASI